MEESWYDGQVYVVFKYAIYEPSSCLAELHDLLYTYIGSKYMLFLILMEVLIIELLILSTQLALIALLLIFYLDYLCAAHTAPHHS